MGVPYYNLIKNVINITLAEKEEFQLNTQLNIFRIFVAYPQHGEYVKHHNARLR